MIAFEPSMFTKPRPGAIIDLLHPINSGLLEKWLFNEGAGIRVSGISGNKNHDGTANNVIATVWGGSPHGSGLSFDGVNDFISVPDASVFSGLASMSVIAHIKGTDTGTSETMLGHFNTVGNQRSWKIETLGVLGIHRILLSDDGTLSPGHNIQHVHNNSFVSLDGTWHMIGFTFDGPSSTLTMYLDGRRDRSPSISLSDSITSLHDSTANIIFGAEDDGTAAFWDGSLGMVGIYDRVLDDREMHTLNVNPFSGLLE